MRRRRALWWIVFLLSGSLLAMWVALVAYLQFCPLSSLSSIRVSTSSPAGGPPVRMIITHPMWTLDPGKFRLILYPMSGGFFRDCRPRMIPAVARTFVYLPLWIPLLFLACVTGWPLRRRRNLPGHCPHCGYSLTGNVSGVCPECGTSIADSDRAAEG